MTKLQEFREKYPAYDDMSDTQLADALYNKHYRDMPREEFNAKLGFEPTSPAMDLLKSIPRGIVQGFTSQALGGDPDVVAAQVGMGQTPEDIIGTQKGIQKELPKALHDMPLPHPQGTAGKIGQSIGEAVGSPASYVGPGGLPAKFAFATLGGTGAEIGGELTEGTGYETLGRVGGALGATALPSALAKGFSPAPISAARQAEVDALKARGIKPSAGDVTGSPRIRHLEEMGDLPGGGASFSRGQEQSARQWTSAVTRKLGINEDLATPEVLEQRGAEIQSNLEKAADRIKIKVDNGDSQLGDGFAAILKDAFDDAMPEALIARLQARINHINQSFVTGDTASTLPGNAYHTITSDTGPLGRMMRDRDENVAYYAGRIRDELDNALERSAHRRGTRPGTGQRAAYDEIQELRRQYYTMHVLRKSTADFGQTGVEGLIDPHKLRINLTNAADRQTIDAVTKLRELGETDLFELSRAGNTVLRPFRERTERGAGYTIPGVTSGVAGRVVNSPLMQPWLKNQVAVPAREFMPPPGWTATRAAVGGTDLVGHDMPEGWSVEKVR